MTSIRADLRARAVAGDEMAARIVLFEKCGKNDRERKRRLAEWHRATSAVEREAALAVETTDPTPRGAA